MALYTGKHIISSVRQISCGHQSSVDSVTVAWSTVLHGNKSAATAPSHHHKQDDADCVMSSPAKVIAKRKRNAMQDDPILAAQ